jgi:hypothetical protein
VRAVLALRFRFDTTFGQQWYEPVNPRLMTFQRTASSPLKKGSNTRFISCSGSGCMSL